MAHTLTPYLHPAPPAHPAPESLFGQAFLIQNNSLSSMETLHSALDR